MLGVNGRGLAVEVIVDLHAPGVDRIFHYEVPAELEGRIRPGHRVLVPFGRREAIEGYVVGFAGQPAPGPLKPLIRLLDEEPVLGEAEIRVAAWMRDYYLCPLVQALQCFLPPGSRIRSARRAKPAVELRCAVADEGRAREALAALERRAPKQAALLRLLLGAGSPLPVAEALRRAGAGRTSLRALVEQGLVVQAAAEVVRDPFPRSGPRRAPFTLNRGQRDALEQIAAALGSGRPARFLLEGVTGSGKTEVYLQAIDACLRLGKGAILLVPEIALTPQTVAAFQGYFGSGVAVLHSRLSQGERYDQWWRLRRGEVKIAVGARSAVFAPVRDLGLIVVDEEHETSYKQEESPRYHAREVAWARVREAGGVLVLGSATPSLESRALAEEGGCVHLRLAERFDKRPLPEAAVVDMREELLAGNRSMFSRLMRAGLEETFARGEQALLFINRRGFASFVLCRSCGHVPRCSSCEVSLTLHEPAELRCHYCDFRGELPAACPRCGGPYLRPFGAGTQRVEQEVRRLFPGVRTARMDLDTTSRKGAHARILSDFEAKRTDVLIGTQMIAKGLHFPEVTFVGVVSADTALHFPDFRAAERTFQLLVQVAGRAGRGRGRGRVVIQTYAPDHYAIQAAARYETERFFSLEKAYRRRAGYPPFSALVRCIWSGEEEEEVIAAAQEAGRRLAGELGPGAAEVLGPAPAPIPKLKSRYRWHLLLRGEREAVTRAAMRIRDLGTGGVRLAVDVDPVGLL